MFQDHTSVEVEILDGLDGNTGILQFKIYFYLSNKMNKIYSKHIRHSD